MDIKPFLIVGALYAFLGVILGAFGAHSLKDKVEPRHLEAFGVGVRYQLIHALALMIIAFTTLFLTSQFFSLSFWLIALGTLIFSGSLYILTLTAVSFWGAITPVGGILLVLGWLFYILGLFFSNSKGA